MNISSAKSMQLPKVTVIKLHQRFPSYMDLVTTQKQETSQTYEWNLLFPTTEATHSFCHNQTLFISPPEIYISTYLHNANPLPLKMERTKSQENQELIVSCEHQEEEDYHNLDEDETNDGSYYIYVINSILGGTARLNILLPTATILAFSVLAPLLTNDGKCNRLERWLTGSFLSLLASSCIFFSLTDSFKTATGRLYYGVATFRGIWTLNGGRKKPLVPSDYKLRWTDLFHASLSLVAFLTFAGSHQDVVGCYYPAIPRKVTNVVPLLVGFVVSVLLVVFPSRRRGIGYPFLVQTDALYSRY